MTLNDFELETAVFEVRYDPALLHWDNAGALWTEIKASVPNLQVETGEPGKTVFRLGDDHEFTAGTDRSHIAAVNPPRDLIQFGVFADTFSDALTRNLHLRDFLRLGLRIVFVKTTANRAESSDLLVSFTSLSPRKQKLFGIDGQSLLPSVSFRWEGEKAGALVRAGAEHRRLAVNLPFGPRPPELTRTKFDRHFVFIDVDYYTIGVVGTGAVRPSQWISHILHSIETDALEAVRVCHG